MTSERTDLTHGARAARWLQRWRCAAPGLMAAVCSFGSAAQTTASSEALPPDVVQLIRQRFATPDAPLRYLDGRTDLNGDGRPELVVYLVGPMVCGTGGCPTLVFTPHGTQGYRLVSTISVSRPPIRAATAAASGWRHLIVHVAGGGAKAADVELRFDGKRYPQNPSVPGPRVRPAQLAGAELVIDDFTAFDKAQPLPATPSSADAPSFDCTKATAEAEKRVCNDAELARLDRDLAARYQTGMKQWSPRDQARARQQQREWLATRNACTRQADAPACLRSTYQRRLVALQIANGELEAPKAVAFLCSGSGKGRSVFMAFYNQTDPRSAVLTIDDRQRVLFVARSASGARYTDGPVEFWEHQGEATIRWSGETYHCKVH